MYDLNECIRSLNVGLPDDIARQNAAEDYKAALARNARQQAEAWTRLTCEADDVWHKAKTANAWARFEP